MKSIVIDGIDVTRKTFDGSRAAEFRTVVVTFTDRGATLSGAVRRDGQAMDAAAVFVFPARRDEWAHYGLTPPWFRSVGIDRGGNFALRDLPAGEYYVVAVESGRAGAWRDPEFLARASHVAQRVTISWGETKAIDLVVAAVR